MTRIAQSVSTDLTLRTLNEKIVIHPADPKGDCKVFACSRLVGVKRSEDVVQCLEHTFKEKGISAERLILNCDGGILTYNLLKFGAWICHPKNPNCCFKSVWNTFPERAYSRLEADATNEQRNAHFKKRTSFGTCKERVD